MKFFAILGLLQVTLAQLVYFDPFTELVPSKLYKSASYVMQLLDAIKEDLFAEKLPLPDAAKLSIPEQIQSHGLTFISYPVITEDGYMLSLWRVYSETAEPKLDKDGKKQVVFMQHGLIDMAGTFFFNEPELSPAYTLAKEGYDMWFGNSRGTVDSLNHLTLSYNDPKYWNFTFEEMGRYDVPANIGFILEETGVDKIIYCGHSQGTMQFWIANMFNDTIGSRIEKMVAFAPVMYEAHQSSIFVGESIAKGIDKLIVDNFMEILVFAPGTGLRWAVDNFAPTVLEWFPRTTWMFVQGIVGVNDQGHLDLQRMPMMAKNDVGGTGGVNIKHWDQLVKTGKFESLDRSAEGGSKPIPYPTEKLSNNLANTEFLLLSGTKDAFSQPEDVEILKSFLPKDKVNHVVIDDYNHLDYMWAKDVDKNVNGHVFDFLKGN